MKIYRRGIIVGFLCVGAAIFAAAPASAQASNSSAYGNAATPPPGLTAAGPIGVASPAGSVLGSAGQRDATPAPGVTGQVLSLQVSQPSPVATGGQASVSGLAFTGTDVITLLLLAVPLILVGLTLTRRARPRQASQG